MITPSFGLTATERVLPRLALDWTTGQSQTGVDVTRAGVATYTDSNGVLQDASADTQRIDYSTGIAGLLVEESRTNGIRNNTMQGAVAGSPGTLPTNWLTVIGDVSITREIVGIGAENGIDYIDIRFSGTASSASFVVVRPETSTQIVASSGQSWTSSMYIRVSAGSTANCSFTYWVVGATAAGSTVETTAEAKTIATSMQRISTSRTLNNANTARVYTYIDFTFPSGASIDITLRIGLPQLEQGAFPTSVIKTSGSAVTRNADVATMTGTNFSDWFNASEGAVMVQYARPVVVPNSFEFEITDGTFNNIIASYTDGAPQQLSGIRSGGAEQATFVYAAGAGTNNAVNKKTVAYKNNSFAGSLNGASPLTDSVGSVPVAPSKLTLGAFGTSQYLNGWVQKFSYWPQRIVNAETQAFSK